MSLIHWWPLNGDTKDYGLDPVVLTVNNAPSTKYIAGKIGQCYNFNGSAWMQASGITVGTDCSVCCWAKTSAAGAMFWGMQCTGSEYMNLYNCGPICLNVGDSAENPFGNVPAANDGLWHHYVVVFKGSEKAKLYIDGVYRAEATKYRNPTMNSKNFTIATWNYSSHGYYWNGGINDVRIYNHSLTQKEIKEISKALVIHYDFEDCEVEATTNRVTSANQPGSCYNGSKGTYGWGSGTDMYKEYGTFQGKQCTKVRMGTAGASAHPFPYFDNVNPYSTTSNTYCTLSFDYYPTSITSMLPYSYRDGIQINSYLNGVDMNGATITNIPLNQWSHIVIVYKRTNDNYSDGCGYVRIGTAAHTSTTTDYWLFANIQSEYKDHATPFVNGTRNTGMVYDSSGYGNHGTLSGNVSVSMDSNLGNHSAYLDNVWCVGSGPSYMDQLTVLMWFKQPTVTQQRFLFGTFDSWTNNGIGWWTDTGDPHVSNLVRVSEASSYTGGSNFGSVCDGNWHCIGVTWDGANYKTYTDGSLIGSVTPSSPGRVYNPVWYIGGALFSNEKMQGKISDFKAFATALSASDIRKEYQAMAGLDKSYKLGSKTFNEDSEGKLYPIISNNGSEIAFDSNNFKTMKLSDGSTWARILWHDVTTDTSMFASVAEAQYCTTKSNRFSLLGAIEKFKSTNNYYEFIYALPELGTIQNGFYNRWKQTSNPITASIGTSSGYTAINIKWSNYFSGGIARSADSGSTYLDTTVGTGASNWWGALGQFTIYQGGFPCSNAVVQKKVELWIRVDNTPMADIASGNVYRLNKNGVFNASEINELGFDSENHFVTYDTGKLVARSFNEK